MAKIVISPDGVKLAKAPGMGNPEPPLRGKASGWSKAVARRNNDFLMSVDGAALAGQGEPYAVSLTFGREEIVSPDALRDVRQSLFWRLRRMGLIRLHWLVEFQGDGTPHLHMLLYLPMADQEAAIRSHWLDVAGWTGARVSGQHVVSVNHLRGWKQYLGKHGIRGFITISGKCRRAGKSRAVCGASWAIGRHGRLNSNAILRHFSGFVVVSDRIGSRMPGRW